MSGRRGTGPDRVRSADVVVVGAGVAGLAAALHADGREVALLAKGAFGGSGSSVHAQGGVAVAMGADDSPDRHADDTLRVAGGLADPEVVRSVTAEGPARIRELAAIGARLDRQSDGRLALGREAAHSRSRIAHAAGDATGAELVRTLTGSVRRLDRVRVVEHATALDLLLDGGRVVGLLAAEGDGGATLWTAEHVVLATGGIGQLWAHTTNPVGSTGDGLAMAARAGARLANLEMMQFHPTALADGSDPMPLLTEALRGEGAVLVDDTGRRLMEGVHPELDLAPRDVVARAIWRARRAGREVLLDATGIGPRFGERFPTVLGLCRERGLDPLGAPVPVAPAAHYHMGGVMADPVGRCSIRGLWACGEVAWTGLHGANRLASNSLLEALVMGARVGGALAASPRGRGDRGSAIRAAARPVRPPAPLGSGGEPLQRLRATMWEDVGLERSAAGLARARAELVRLADDLRGPGELANALLVARMVTRAATLRTESRGAHFRADLPYSEPSWRQDLVRNGLEPVGPVPLPTAVAV